MRKRWIIVPMIAGLLALGIMGGTAAAQSAGGSDGASPVRGLLSRVASILGIEQSQVEDAFQQAAQEMKLERVQSKLDYMVEQGRITQEQATEYFEWYQSRPDIGIGRGFGFGGRGFGQHMRGRKGFGGSKFHQQAPASEIPQEQLQSTTL